MTIQTADGFLVNIKVETTEGVAATGGASTGERLRVTRGSPGLKLDRIPIRSNEARNDGNAGKARLGSKSVSGSHNFELSVGSFDTLFEAFFRSTWVAAATITFNNGAALTSLTVNTASQITFAGTTTPAAAGLCVGDVFRLANMSTAANNGVNCRVKAITGSVVDLHGTPLTIQAADTACDLTIGKKLKQAVTPTHRTITVEQHKEEADVSENFLGCRPVSLEMRLRPDGMVECTVGWIGLDRTALGTGASPYFTSPTEYTSIALVATDASIVYNGTAIASLTEMTLRFTIAAKGEPVIGSTTMPGTFDNMMTAEGDITGHLSDFSNLTLFDAETEFEIHLMLVEPEAEPKSYFAMYLPAVKIMGIDGNGLGGDGAYLEKKTINLQPRVAATGYDAGILTICTAA